MWSLVEVILVALCQVLFVAWLRALPWPARWKRLKPLNCNVCLVLYAGALCITFERPLIAFAASGLAYLILSTLTYLRGPEEPPNGDEL